MTRRQKSAVLATVVSLVAIAAFEVMHLSTNRAMPLPSESELDSYDSDINADALVIYFTPKQFEPDLQYLSVDLLPAPSGDLGDFMASGTWFLTNFDLQLTPDAVMTSAEDLRTGLFYEGHPTYWIAYGAAEVQLDIAPDVEWGFRNTAYFYPFDTYPYILAVIAERRPWSDDVITETVSTASLSGWELMAIDLSPWLAEISGYEFDVRPAPYGALAREPQLDLAAADANSGYASYEIRVRRSTGVRVLVALVAAMMILNLAALLRIMWRVVASKRPPSAQILVWVAALSFATIAVRQALPLAPPPGILLDYLLFFPTLVIGAICTVVIGSSWSTREDFVP